MDNYQIIIAASEFIERTEAMQWANLTIALFTFVGCLYLVPSMIDWKRRLRHSPSKLRDFVAGVAKVKFGLGWLAVMNMANTIINDNTQPLMTLPPRLFILYGVLEHVWIAWRMGPAPLPTSIEEELDKDGRFVLIVEDDEALARIYRRQLESVGINAEFATNGADALTILNLEPLRLLLVDLGLPDMRGIELARRARAAGYAGPIIASSGDPSLLDPSKMDPALFSATLEKPARKEALVAAVYRWSAP